MSISPVHAICEICGTPLSIIQCRDLYKWGPIPLCKKCRTPERIAAFQERQKTKGRKKSQKYYAHRDSGAKARKDAQLHYMKTKKGRKARREAQARYRKTAKGKAAYERALANRHKPSTNIAI